MEELREKFLGKNKITNWADCEDSDSLPSSHDDLAETVTQAVSVDGSKSSKNAKASNAKKAAAGPNPRLFQGALRGIVDQKQPMTRPPASNNHSNGSQSSQSSRHRSNSRPTASNFDQQQPAEADIRESQPKANGKIPLQSIDQKQLIKHAEALKQTIVTFQAPTLKRLNEIIDVIHQHTSVTLQFILWRRTIDVPSQGKRNPIVVIRYTRKELAQLIRMACKAFVEQTKAKDL